MKITPPQPGIHEDDRDIACYDALTPHIEALFRQGVAAGWHPAEILVNTMAMCAGELAQQSSTTATIEILNNIIIELKIS